MHMSSLVVDKARQLAAAGHHAEVIEYLGAQERSELADSPTLALLYGTAQARLGRNDEGLRWLDRAGVRHGVAECHHNLGITYREQGELDRALAEADRAAAEAEAFGDRTLWALALRGRAEIRLCRSELEPARRELEAVRAIRGGVPNPVAEAEDLRVAALLSLAEGQAAGAEGALRPGVSRAESHGRPQLLAEATRDLVVVLRRAERQVEAQAAARTAKALFTRLGAEGEIRKLAGQGWDEAFTAELRGALAPLHVAQH